MTDAMMKGSSVDRRWAEDLLRSDNVPVATHRMAKACYLIYRNLDHGEENAPYCDILDRAVRELLNARFYRGKRNDGEEVEYLRSALVKLFAYAYIRGIDIGHELIEYSQGRKRAKNYAG